MESQQNIEKTFTDKVENNNRNLKRVIFQQLSTDLTDFPELTEKDLKVFLT